MHNKTASGPGWELRQGDWREVLADVVKCDAVITDPPYSERTHAGQRSDQAAHSKSFVPLEYASFTANDVSEFVRVNASRCRGWFVVFSDHTLQIEYEKALEEIGRYVFAPLPQVTTNRSVRLAGDGPATWTTWLTVSRPRSLEYSNWGALRGAYIDGVGDRKPGVVHGAKQLHTMRAIVRDYSRPGDLIIDLCAGGGTTLLAAVIEGRRAIGAEIDLDTFNKAAHRLQAGYTPGLFK